MTNQWIYCHICGDHSGPWGIGYWKEKDIYTMMCENCLNKRKKKGTKKDGKA